jgi:hypothetical protein
VTSIDPPPPRGVAHPLGVVRRSDRESPLPDSRRLGRRRWAFTAGPSPFTSRDGRRHVVASRGLDRVVYLCRRGGPLARASASRGRCRSMPLSTGVDPHRAAGPRARSLARVIRCPRGPVREPCPPSAPNSRPPRAVSPGHGPPLAARWNELATSSVPPVLARLAVGAEILPEGRTSVLPASTTSAQPDARCSSPSSPSRTSAAEGPRPLPASAPGLTSTHHLRPRAPVNGPVSVGPGSSSRDSTPAAIRLRRFSRP